MRCYNQRTFWSVLAMLLPRGALRMTYFDGAFGAGVATHGLHLAAESAGRPVDDGLVHGELARLPPPHPQVTVRHVPRLVFDFLIVHYVIPVMVNPKSIYKKYQLADN